MNKTIRRLLRTFSDLTSNFFELGYAVNCKFEELYIKEARLDIHYSGKTQ